MKKTRLLALLCVSLLGLWSCATTSTRVTSTWKSPEYSGMIRKVLIIGIANIPAYRILYENEFAENLRKQGVTGIPSFTLFASTGAPDRPTIETAVKKSGADSVLIAQLVDREKVKTYVPGNYSPSYDNFYDFYAYSWDYVYTPGYTVVDRVMVMQTNLYSTLNQKLVWTAVSDTTTQGNNTDVIKSFVRAVVSRMKREKLIR